MIKSSEVLAPLAFNIPSTGASINWNEMYFFSLALAEVSVSNWILGMKTSIRGANCLLFSLCREDDLGVNSPGLAPASLIYQVYKHASPTDDTHDSIHPYAPPNPSSSRCLHTIQVLYTARGQA